jgi:autotransporter-associated beta strand protein
MKLKKNFRTQLSQVALICALLPQTMQAVIITKAANANALNLGTSWVGGVAPGSADLMLWDSTYTAVAQASLPLLSADMAVDGIMVTNPAGAANTANVIVGSRHDGTVGAPIRVLTIGASGISMSSATKAIRIDAGVKLGANQTWSVIDANTVGNPSGFNNGEDVAFLAPALTDFDMNGRTLTTSGTGQITLSSGYTLRNGTVNIGNNLFVVQGGTNRLTTIASTASINIATGSQLRLQSNSGALNSAAAITTNGTLRLLNNNSGQPVTQSGALTMNAGILETSMTQPGLITISGLIAAAGAFTWNTTGTLAHADGIAVTGNLTGSSNILYQNVNTSSPNGLVRFSGDNSGYTGTFTINGGSGNRSLRLNAINSGSAAATWNVAANNVLQVNGVAVQLGTLQGLGTVTNSHATNGAAIHVGAGTFAGIIANGGGTMSVVKKTAGTVVLSGNCTYTGATTVEQGLLAISTVGTGATPITVADGAALRLDIASQDAQRTVQSVALGTTTGSSLLVNAGTLLNPSAAPLVTTDLTVNAPTTLEYIGGNITTGTFPLVGYTNINGTLGFSGLTLKLPSRILGNLINNTAANRIDVEITSAQGIRWKGSVDSNWDVDPTGAGTTGTANWETTVTTAATRFLQAPSSKDAALFDDLAAGTGDVSVNLTTKHMPTAISINNPTRNYIFAGSGSLSGITVLEKSGAGSLQISNTTANDYAGGTLLDEGSIILGDGVTAGAGVISGTIDSLAGTSLVLNRPDDHNFTNPLTGVGKLVKNQANTVTIANAYSANYDLEVNAGTLKFTGGGTLSRLISGAGNLEISGGIVTFNGSVPNTISGTTTIRDATVTFANSAGTAIAGDLVIAGTSRISPTVGTQLAPTASISVIGSNSDAYLSGVGLSAEVVTNVLVNSTVPGGGGAQFIMRNGMTVTGLATLNTGVLGVGSGNTATVKAINITAPNTTDAILRIAGSGASSTLNIGDGGVTASGGDWQIKFNTNNQDAIVNLGGDVTTTGNFLITNAGYNGVNRNVINLTGTRTFTIAENTTTSMSPDFADDATLTADLEDSFTGNLVKAGAGKLILNPLCNVGHSGTTSVTAGTLIVNGTMPNQAPQLSAGATLGGNGTITAATTIPSGATISPGDGTAATLNFVSDVTLSTGSTYAVDITGASAVDRISTPAAALSVNGTIAVTLTGYTPVLDDVFDLADASSITGTPTFDFTAAPLASGLGWDTSSFATDGKIKVVSVATGFEVFAQSITNPDDRDPLDDADGDGISNLLEYVLGGVPTVAAQTILPNSTTSATELVFSFKRSDASEADTTQVVEVSSDLINWSTVIPVTAASGGNVTVLENGVADDDVTVTIAKGVNTEMFARLKVTKP